MRRRDEVDCADRAGWGSSICLCAGLAMGCAATRVPPPEAAAREFAEAAERGDADAIYGLMTAADQRAHGVEGTRLLVKDARRELAAAGKAVSGAELTVETTAVVRFESGERAELVAEGDAFRIQLADVQPTRASTPQAALGALRVALSRRSFSAVFRLLSEETRAAIERDLAAVVAGLEDPDSLDVEVVGDRAAVALGGGHTVLLRREDGVWRVEELE